MKKIAASGVQTGTQTGQRGPWISSSPTINIWVHGKKKWFLQSLLYLRSTQYGVCSIWWHIYNTPPVHLCRGLHMNPSVLHLTVIDFPAMQYTPQHNTRGLYAHIHRTHYEQQLLHKVKEATPRLLILLRFFYGAYYSIGPPRDPDIRSRSSRLAKCNILYGPTGRSMWGWYKVPHITCRWPHGGISCLAIMRSC